MKTKLMVMSDWPCAGTGFSEELRNITYRLAQSGEYDIYWVGYNYMGFPTDLPDTVFDDLRPTGATVKCLSGTGDPSLYGLDGFKREYERFSPDLFMAMGDPNNFIPYVKYRRRTGVNFPFMTYVTLDGLPIHPSWHETFKGINIPIVMTEWALLEYQKAGIQIGGYIHHGVNWQYMATNQIEKRRIRHALGIADDTVLFIDWNVNQHRKRLDALLRSWKEFHPETKKAKLFLYTDSDMSGSLGWRLDALIEQIGVPRSTVLLPEDLNAPLGRRKVWERPETIKFHKAIIQAGDIMVSCTSGEGFGKCFLEAMSLGMPVITTATSALNEVCEKGAMLVPIHDDIKFRWPDRHRSVYGDIVREDKFTEAMLRLYDNPEERAEIGAQGREWSRNFDYDTQIIPGWKSILEQIDPYTIMTEETLRRVM